MSLIFAIDPNTEEVIVSESPKGSVKIQFLERIPKQENIHLYKAVELLTSLTASPNLDTAIFKATDKVCQMIYTQHKGL